MNIRLRCDFITNILKAVYAAVAVLRLLAVDVSSQTPRSSLPYAVERFCMSELDWTDGIWCQRFTTFRHKMLTVLV